MLKNDDPFLGKARKNPAGNWRSWPTTAAMVAGLLACAQPASAELIIGLTTSNEITSFDSATPGAATVPIFISGLVAGDTLVGIDRRPQSGPMNGLLYALGVQGTTGRVYTVNETTGVASLASTLSAPVNGSSFGVDFNPVPDRLRVVSDLDQNLRINVDTGTTIIDGTLAYDAADTNSASNPGIVAVAYSNNFGGATSTVLRDLDAGLDILATQLPPNDGTLNTQFPLNVDLTNLAGYDISGISGTPFLAFTADGGASSFYTISGAGAVFVGPVSSGGRGGIALRGIAAPVGVPQPVPETLSSLFAAMVLIGTLAAGSFFGRARVEVTLPARAAGKVGVAHIARY